MGRFAILVAFLATGCAQLFGLDETTGGAPDATMTFQRVSIGARLVYAPQELAGSMATYLVPDEADPAGFVRVPAAQAEVGTWTAPIRQGAPLLFDLPDYPAPLLRIFDFPQPAVKSLFGVMEHPNPQPAPADATLAVAATLDIPYAAGDLLQLYVVGPWTVRNLEPPAAGTLDYAVGPFLVSSMSSITGRPNELITAEDGAVVLRYTGNQLLGAAEIAAFTQGQADTLTGTLIPVTPEPFEMAIDQAAITSRYSAVRPLVGDLAMSWAVHAAPGSRLNNDNGPLLNAGGVAADAATIAIPHANPFLARGWESTLLWVTESARSYTPPSAGLPVRLAAGMHQRAVPTAGTPVSMLLPAGLPELITLDDKPLSTDGLAIAKPTRGVEVSFITDVADNTLYQLQLFELAPNATATELVRTVRISTAGSAPRFVLPPEVFEAGKLYTVRAIAVSGGFPNAAEGDLVERTLPIGVAFLDSGVFQVMP